MKRRGTLWVDVAVIDRFKRQGPGDQTRMNEVLKRYVAAQKAEDGRSTTSSHSKN